MIYAASWVLMSTVWFATGVAAGLGIARGHWFPFASATGSLTVLLIAAVVYTIRSRRTEAELRRHFERLYSNGR